MIYADKSDLINLYYFYIPNIILYYLLLQYYLLLTVEKNVLQIDVNDDPKMYCALIYLVRIW